jgi:hypothetical protein
MLAINARELVHNTSDDRPLWDEVISEVMHYRCVSMSLRRLVRREHERRGHGKRPTIDTVRLVVQACEDEGIFGLGT